MNKPSGKYNEIQLTDGWKTIVARNFDQIEAIRPIWEKIQDREPYPVFNADVDQYLSVVDSMKESVKPYVMVLSYDGTPEAMVIGRIEEHRQRILEVGIDFGGDTKFHSYGLVWLS